MTGHTPRRAARRRGLALLGGALGAAALAACTDVPSSPETPFSIAFEHLPFPAVVLGDLLRDSTGAVASLEATVFNAAGEPIPDASIEYFVVGGAAVLLPGNQVRGDTLDGEVRITAVAGGIPSLPRTLRVVRRPDSLAGPTGAIEPIQYTPLPNPTLNRSGPLTVRVLATPAGAQAVGVPSWVVRYEVLVEGVRVAPTDTSLVWLVNDAGRPAVLDTTDAGGEATLRLRVDGANPAIDDLDSVVVSVTAQGVATPLRGAPVLLIVPIRPRQ